METTDPYYESQAAQAANQAEAEEMERIEAQSKPIKTTDWWNDLYTDATGNCFSDADSGL